MNYTRGQWVFGEATIPRLGNMKHIVVGIAGTRKIIASTGEKGANDEPESIANALLISQAPAMYEALKGIYELTQGYSPMPHDLIAKKIKPILATIEGGTK